MGVINQIVNGVRDRKICIEQIEEITNSLSKSEQEKLLIALKELHSVHTESLIRNKENLMRKNKDIASIRQSLEDINISAEEVERDLKIAIASGEELSVDTNNLLHINYFRALLEVDFYNNYIKQSNYLLPILESFIDRLASKIN